MPLQHFDRIKETTTTTGTGTLTLAGAVTGFRSFADIGNANTCPYVLLEDSETSPTAWEVGIGTYTSSGTTLARTTVLRTSAGNATAINLSSGTHTVLSNWSATLGQSAYLGHVTGADADTAMAVGTLYVTDMSGWATADRTYTLPSAAVAGDRCGILITAGDASHELIITAASGDTLNGVAGGSEWSRLFITGEVVLFRCIADNATWVVEHDGRIPQCGFMRLTTAADGESPATFTRPTLASSAGAWTADADIGAICSTTGDSIKTRRAGRFTLTYIGLAKDTGVDTNYTGSALFHNGTTNILQASTVYMSGINPGNSNCVVSGYPMAVDDYVVYMYRSQAGSLGLGTAASPRVVSGFSLVEILP